MAYVLRKYFGKPLGVGGACNYARYEGAMPIHAHNEIKYEFTVRVFDVCRVAVGAFQHLLRRDNFHARRYWVDRVCGDVSSLSTGRG